MNLIGEHRELAFEIFEPANGGITCIVDMFTRDRHLTFFDNSAFIPQFCLALRYAAVRLSNPVFGTAVFWEVPFSTPWERLHEVVIERELYGRHAFLQLGSTTDSFSRCLFTLPTDFPLVFDFYGHPPRHVSSGCGSGPATFLVQ